MAITPISGVKTTPLLTGLWSSLWNFFGKTLLNLWDRDGFLQETTPSCGKNIRARNVYPGEAHHHSKNGFFPNFDGLKPLGFSHGGYIFFTHCFNGGWNPMVSIPKRSNTSNPPFQVFPKRSQKGRMLFFKKNILLEVPKNRGILTSPFRTFRST